MYLASVMNSLEECVISENICTCPMEEGYFGLSPPPPLPCSNSSFPFYFPLKILAFETPHPHLWVG